MSGFATKRRLRHAHAEPRHPSRHHHRQAAPVGRPRCCPAQTLSRTRLPPNCTAASSVQGRRSRSAVTPEAPWTGSGWREYSYGGSGEATGTSACMPPAGSRILPICAVDGRFGSDTSDLSRVVHWAAARQVLLVRVRCCSVDAQPPHSPYTFKTQPSQATHSLHNSTYGWY